MTNSIAKFFIDHDHGSAEPFTKVCLYKVRKNLGKLQKIAALERKQETWIEKSIFLE